jgi:peptide/nickel transport system ATP-binding protein
MNALLSISNLSVCYGEKLAVDGISLDIHAGEAVGVIGESGSGKSMTALAILGLLPQEAKMSGRILYRGQDLASLDENGLRALRGRRISMVFQDPMNSLNPLMTVGAQMVEAVRAHAAVTVPEARSCAHELLEEVGLPQPYTQLDRYPFELSGGQQQRVMIAMALASKPELLIADEPTTALDVTTQAQVLALLRRIQRGRGMAMLFVSHDLHAVNGLVDRVAVMQKGKVLECGSTDQVMQRPTHPYTQSLVAANKPVMAGRRPSSRQVTGLAIALDSVCLEYRSAKMGQPPHRVVHDVSVQLREGAALGIVGESGSGKSTLARAVMGMLSPAAGSVRVLGMDPADHRQRRKFASHCQFVFQDTTGSLNPRRTIAQTLAEPQQIHAPDTAANMARRSAVLMEEVGLEPALLTRYPHQLSGGQRQRIVIARALATNPRILVCDEPVSALDATVRTQVLALIARLRQERNLTLVFIGHDLTVMESVAEETMVLKKGRVVEYGATQQIFSAPKHVYTQSLMAFGRWGDRDEFADPKYGAN